MVNCSVCGKSRDARVEIFTLPPPAMPKPKELPKEKPRERMRTDPDLFEKRREKVVREKELLKGLLDEVSEVSRISHETIEKAKLEPGKLLDPKAQSIEVPNTWWGWLLVVALATVIIGAAIITGKSLLSK